MPDEKSPVRIASIDQYRGYAIFGMIFVNFLGQFDSMPWMFKHHHYHMSYADTIAPLFMFVVGMGMRLSLQRRAAIDGFASAHLAAFRRYLTLIGVGIVLYGPSLDNWRYWWDALVDIGFAGILALPFLTRSTTTRTIAAFGYVILFQILFMTTGYEAWTMKRSIDGGPLGPLSWVFMLLLGTIAYDLIATGNRKRIVWGCIAWGIALCALGWALRLEWPGVKAAWPFTQRGMSIPYPLYSTGLCFLMYLPFYFICDVKGWRLPHLTALGLNPLVIYIVQQALGDMHKSFIVSEESGPAMAVLGFAAFYLSCYAVAWRLQKDKIVIKL
ncbi:MAG: heparan-alpha-glucosaminide N-acetyltransferase domain-containing protein [Candidatus Hydrogenedentales bacterium]|jgi:predicted acyltransferase